MIWRVGLEGCLIHKQEGRNFHLEPVCTVDRRPDKRFKTSAGLSLTHVFHFGIIIVRRHLSQMIGQGIWIPTFWSVTSLVLYASLTLRNSSSFRQNGLARSAKSGFCPDSTGLVFRGGGIPAAVVVRGATLPPGCVLRAGLLPRGYIGRQLYRVLIRHHQNQGWQRLAYR